MKKQKIELNQEIRAAGQAPQRCVLVGTYRMENLEWIVKRGLYNLPLAEGVSPATYTRFNAVVLYANDNTPIARYAEFDRVVDGVWLKSNGYKVASNPHANK